MLGLHRLNLLPTVFKCRVTEYMNFRETGSYGHISTIPYCTKLFTKSLTRNIILSKRYNSSSIKNRISHAFAIQHLKILANMGRWSGFFQDLF